MSKSKLIPVFYFILCVILGLLLSNLIIIYMMYLKHGDLATVISNTNELLFDFSSKELLMTQMCSQVLTLIIPAFIFSKLIAQDNFYYNRKDFQTSDLLPVLLFFLSSIPLVAFSAYLNQLIPLTEWMQSTELQMMEMIQRMLDYKNFWDVLIALIVIGLIPAIGEEWVFRGILQNLFVEWTKNKWIGLLLAAIFFSAIHMQFQGFLPRLILGFLLGYVYLTTANLWYPILLHFINNGFQVLAAYFYKDEIMKQIQHKVELPSPWVLVLSLIITLFLGYILQVRSHKILKND